MWNCAAIDHGVTIFPNGKIGPCCQISFNYLKPISELNNPNRFADLKTEQVPPACYGCDFNEYNKIPSYREFFAKMVTNKPGIQFVDIRNTNQCNLKCRYCGPHYSDKWAEELGYSEPTRKQSIEEYKDLLFTDSTHWLYFTGGEPLINPEHWSLLEELIATNRSSNIALQYNTNLTTIKYKNKNIIDLWSKFKTVDIQCSVDSWGVTNSYIRSGSDWTKISKNIHDIAKVDSPNIRVNLNPVVSLLNIWSIKKLFEYAQTLNIPVDPILLTGPTYLALNALPDEFKDRALSCAKELKEYIPEGKYNRIVEMITNNENSWIFPRTLSHILLLDKLRGEDLFSQLPFAEYAKAQILNNHEFE